MAPRKQLAPEDSLSKAEAAQLAGVTQRTIGRWVSNGHLTRYTGQVNRLRVSRAQLIKFLAGTRSQT
jgi:excisionase family DNA binding protein